MKKIKLVPVLAIVALLSACGVNKGISMKAPKFAKQGEEVSYTEFKAKLDEAFEASEIVKEDAKFGDRVITTKEASLQKTVVKNGKKELGREERKSAYEDKFQYDFDNFVGNATCSFKGYTLSKDAHGEKTSEDNENTSAQFQFGEGTHSNRFYCYDLDNKFYYLEAALADGETKDHLFGIFLKEGIYDALNEGLNAIPSNEEQAAEFKFYVNGKTFTFIDSYDESGDMKDDGNNVIGTYKDKGELKIQIDFTDGAQKLKIAMEVSENSNYTAAYQSYGEGDEVTSEIKMYVDNNVQSKKVSLKAIDTSDFIVNPLI